MKFFERNVTMVRTSLLLFAIISVNAMNALVHAAGDRQPNIIYINTDDWGIGKVPCYGML